jgi:hypothetical protein
VILAAVKSSIDIASTLIDHIQDLPPLPVEVVKSIIKSEQLPNCLGMFITIFGKAIEAASGANIVVFI